MPIGRTPPLSTPQETVVAPPGVVAAPGCPWQDIGTAVAIIEIDGVAYYQICGADTATGHPGRFFGFLKTPMSQDGSPLVVVGRGSIVTPVVEDGVTLTAGEPVYLALTPGSVTQTAPAIPGSTIVLIGFAISTTKMVMAPDTKVIIPG